MSKFLIKDVMILVRLSSFYQVNIQFTITWHDLIKDFPWIFQQKTKICHFCMHIRKHKAMSINNIYFYYF